MNSPTPRYALFDDMRVGKQMLIVGYPFGPLGSYLQTAEQCSVSALGKRLFLGVIPVYELIVAHYTHSGSSGSPLVSMNDGLVCGMVRGCLAPPERLAIGNLPLGTESSVTYAVSSDSIQRALNSI